MANPIRSQGDNIILDATAGFSMMTWVASTDDSTKNFVTRVKRSGIICWAWRFPGVLLYGGHDSFNFSNALNPMAPITIDAYADAYRAAIKEKPKMAQFQSFAVRGRNISFYLNGEPLGPDIVLLFVGQGSVNSLF